MYTSDIVSAMYHHLLLCTKMISCSIQAAEALALNGLTMQLGLEMTLMYEDNQMMSLAQVAQANAQVKI